MKQHYPVKTLKPVNTSVTNDAYSYNVYTSAIAFYMDKPFTARYDSTGIMLFTNENSCYTYYINNTYALTDTYYYNHTHAIDYIYIPASAFQCGTNYNYPTCRTFVDTGGYSNYTNKTYNICISAGDYNYYSRFLYPEDIKWNGTFRYSIMWMLLPQTYDSAGYHIDQIDAASDTIILSGHGFVENAVVLFPTPSSTWRPYYTALQPGRLPRPLNTGTTYYAVNTGTNSFQVALTTGGTPIDLIDDFYRTTPSNSANGYIQVSYNRYTFKARATVNDYTLPTTPWVPVDDEHTKFYEIKYTNISAPVSIHYFNKSREDQICLLQVYADSATAWQTGNGWNAAVLGIILFSS